ncbi:MAG TPA: hypothetical protein VFP34_09415 [Microlunatus sp.]|nr:hypothetical protein [Microlunatus sp.]
MQEYAQVEFASAAELRAWLAEHHADSPGIWAIYGKKSAGERCIPYEDVVRQALCFGWVDIRGRGLDETRTQMLLTPRRAKSTWSAPNRRRVSELEADGLMTDAGRAAVAAARAGGTWET